MLEEEGITGPQTEKEEVEEWRKMEKLEQPDPTGTENGYVCVYTN